MTSAFIDIPSDLLREIITHVSLPALIQLCQTDTIIRKICDNERLLSQVIFHQTGYTTKPEQLTWKQFAILLSSNQIRQVDISYQRKVIGNVWLWPTQTVKQVVDEVLSLYRGSSANLVLSFSSDIHIIIPENIPDTKNNNQYPSLNNSIWLNTNAIKINDYLQGPARPCCKQNFISGIYTQLSPIRCYRCGARTQNF